MKKLSLISVVAIIAISLNSCKNPVEKIEGKWITDLLGMNAIADIKVSKDSLFIVMKTEITNEKIQNDIKYKIDSTKMDTIFVSSGGKYNFRIRLFTVKDTLFKVSDAGTKMKYVRYKK